MGRYKKHLQIIAAALGVFVLVGFASVFAARDDSKYEIHIGKNRARLLPTSEWGFSSGVLCACGPTHSSSTQIRKIGVLEVQTPLE